MSYAAIGATASAVPGALRALPACYTPTFDDCLEERSRDYPSCDLINEAYEEDFELMEGAVDSLPYCEPGSAQVAGMSPVLFVGVTAGVALLAGLTVGLLAA